MESKNDFVKSRITDLNNMIDYLKKILNQLKDKINSFNTYTSNLINKINEYINLLNSIKIFVDNKENQECIKNIKLAFNEYHCGINNIFSNDSIKEIRKPINNIKQKLNNIINFNPPKENSFFDYSKSISIDEESKENESQKNLSFSGEISHISKYSRFYNNTENSKDIDDNISNLKEKLNEEISKFTKECYCIYCKQKKVRYFSENYDLICEKCYKINSPKMKITHIGDDIYEFEEKGENEKNEFLKLIISLINWIIFKYNLLLIKESKGKKYYQNNIFHIPFLKKEIKDSSKNNENEFQSQIDFIKQLIIIILSKIYEKNKNIKKKFNEINDDKIQLTDPDQNFFSDDSLDYLNQIENQKYYLINEISNYNYSNINKNKINEINNENPNLKQNNIFISPIKPNIFIDCFIKTKDFSSLSLEEIKEKFPNAHKLQEIKELINSLIFDCKINPNLLDSAGNSIFFNINNNSKRGNEKYYPPNNWIGIGLKAIGKYNKEYNDEWIINNSESSKWTVAYHGLGFGLSSNKIKEILNKVLNSNLEPEKFQLHRNSPDKRHKDKKIGDGIYLCPNLEHSEPYAGIIRLNQKKYKIALMTRVLIDKIREPKDIKYFVLDNQYIRIYRILLKEVIDNLR